MSEYVVTDTELTAVANAIRTKGGTSADLEWNADFISAINAISGGGGASNCYVQSFENDTLIFVISDNGMDVYFNGYTKGASDASFPTGFPVVPNTLEYSKAYGSDKTTQIGQIGWYNGNIRSWSTDTTQTIAGTFWGIVHIGGGTAQTNSWEEPPTPLQAKNILSGTNAPTASVGSDGDIYLRYGLEDFTPFQKKAESSMSVDISSSNIVFDYLGGNYIGAQAYKQYDLTDIDTISFSITSGSHTYNNYQTAKFCPQVFIENTLDPSSNFVANTLSPIEGSRITANNTNVTLDVDVSELTGNYWIVFCSYGCDSTVDYLNTGSDNISATYCKVNGAWQSLIGQDIDDVNTEGGGGVLSGESAPSASLGSDGDLYVQKMDLPDDVNFVEYLKSSGTQYINTGVYATQDIDATVTSDRGSGTSGSSANIGCALGVRTGGFSSMSKTIYFGSHTDNNGGISVIKTGSSNEGTVSNKTGVSTRRTKTHKDVNGYYTYCSTIDEVASYAKMYRQTGSWQSDHTLYMFAFYNSNTFSSANSAKVHRVTLFDKGVPIKDYLPCLDDNDVPCMWDNIAKEYVYNDGTGTFAYGNTVTPTKISDVLYEKKNGAWVYVGDVDDVNTGE